MWRIAVSDNFLYHWGWRFTRDWFDLLGGGTRTERIHDWAVYIQPLGIVRLP